MSTSPQHRGRPSWMPSGPLTDRVRVTACPRCGRIVLEALADGVLATEVDPVLLTPRQELLELLSGGSTLRLWPDRGVRHLSFRGAAQIRLHPGQGLPRHECDRQHGPPDPALLPTRRTTATPTDCPF